MAKDKNDKSTAALALTRRGRPPKMQSGAMSAAERKAAERARRAAAHETQIWVSRTELKMIKAWREDKELYRSMISHFRELIENGIHTEKHQGD